MLRKRSSLTTLALFFVLAASPGVAALLVWRPALAQSSNPTEFPLPREVPSGTTVKVNGSTSMQVINEALKQRFEARYDGTTVDLAAVGTDQALALLRAGSIDLAAIGRPLTSQEKADGLVEVPISREKIAVIVGPENSFNSNLTFEQFAQIFRGEVTNWSQVGGADMPIRFVDRPESSDTRRALSSYKVFTGKPFKTGATATQVADDETATVVKELGKDGISYAIASQVLDQPTVKVLPMHQTLPDNPRYPFSQPRSYAYFKTSSPVIQAFLGFATSPEGQEVVEEAKEAEAAAVADADPASAGAVAAAGAGAAATAPEETSIAQASPAQASPDAVGDPAASPTTNKPSDPWPLIAVLTLGGLALLGSLWLKNRRSASPSPSTGRTISPADGTDPIAAGDVVEEPSVAARAGSVIASDRASIGLANGAIAGTGALGGLAAASAMPKSKIVLTPRSSEDVYAYWEVPESRKAELRKQGGESLKLRVYDVTELGSDAALPETFEEFAVSEADTDRHVAIAQPDRAYLAEIGYTTSEGQWLPLAASSSVQVPAVANPTVETNGISGAAMAAGGAALGLGAAAIAALRRESSAETPAATSESELSSESLEAVGEPAMLEVPSDLEPVEEPAVEETVIQVVEPELAIASEADVVPESALQEPAVVASEVDSSSADSESSRKVIGAVMAAGDGAAIASLSVQTDAQSTVEAAKFDVGQSDLSAEQLADVDADLPPLPEGYGESRIILLPRDPHWAYAYWDVPSEHREELRRQGGQRLGLRVYDVTDIDTTRQNPHSMQQYDCDEMARDWYLPVPVSDRDYLAEIGYLTGDGQWLLLARSNIVRIPPVFPSDWYEDLFMTLDWSEDLRGKVFTTLIPPGQRTTFDNPIYDEIFGLTQSTEAERVAGSLFGSMQQVPGSVFGSMQMASGAAIGSMQAASGAAISSMQFASGAAIGSLQMASGAALSSAVVSSYIFPSGVGMLAAPGAVGPGAWTIPTQSGVGMWASGAGIGALGLSGWASGAGIGASGVGGWASGMGMSGVGMWASGIGFSGSVQPIRPRKFWLIADAELIVYGATEPDATVYINGEPIKISDDGTFRFQVAFPDGKLDYPIFAVAADGVQARSIHMKFERETPERNTNTRDEAQDEWPS